ncbi:hypothetical protein QWY28_21625 [Nocardioides sp. SOB77]|uniref:HEPN AbiU2-like domain-containing protein n=1 Tax=Nocardioides oceani TaxID=3058369 RepID=A0ABT8FLM2_9ACTN|nr:hypothetical protein [Nocardioides oceani]MDN4175578.1 hypothetical protein [Nocardioides oceani]
MERLVRIAVHMQEAVRLGSSRWLEHQRLALILLDNAAELLMNRCCEDLLRREDFDLRELRNIERAQAWRPDLYRTEPMARRLDELRARTTSIRRRKRIERDFNEKARFLVERDQLQPTYARILLRLHAYRNEAYHRDEVRPETLSSAVEIYTIAACHLMRTLTTGTMIGYSRDAPEPLRRFSELFSQARTPFDVQPAIADALLVEAGLAGVSAVREVLRSNMTDRLDTFEDVLAELAGAWPDRGWTPETVLAQLQLPDEPQNAFLGPADVASLSLPLGPDDLTRWRQGVTEIGEADDVLAAFTVFANFEEAFEELESAALAAIRAYEEYLDLEMERMRGN